jgi:hemolysin activation/secretion protein
VRPLLLVTALTTVASAAIAAVVVMPEGEADAHAAPAHVQEVQSIALDGRHLPVQQLRQTLTTHVGEKLDAVKLQRDRNALETSLVGQGYLTAHVAEKVTFARGGAAFVTFAVEQGPLFHLRSVSARDSGVLTIGKGDVAQADRLERARVALAERLGKPVAIHQAVDVNAGVVDVELVAR